MRAKKLLRFIPVLIRLTGEIWLISLVQLQVHSWALTVVCALLTFSTEMENYIIALQTGNTRSLVGSLGKQAELLRRMSTLWLNHQIRHCAQESKINEH